MHLRAQSPETFWHAPPRVMRRGRGEMARKMLYHGPAPWRTDYVSPPKRFFRLQPQSAAAVVDADAGGADEEEDDGCERPSQQEERDHGIAVKGGAARFRVAARRYDLEHVGAVPSAQQADKRAVTHVAGGCAVSVLLRR
jgi:hypothetical protein